MKHRFLLKQWRIFYLLGFVMIVVMKLYYSHAGSDELRWILAPTTWWVQILSGTMFEYVSGHGYVNHGLQFIIAPSCSGVQFMLISLAAFLFSFVHRMKNRRAGVCWLIASVVGAYGFTIFVNGLRIVVSIYLPLYLPLHQEWLTPERYHSLIGIAVYFSALLAGYHAAGLISHKIACGGRKMPVKNRISRCLPPVCWYFFIVLGIPFLNRVKQKNFDGFGEYAILIISTCAAILLLLWFGCRGYHIIVSSRSDTTKSPRNSFLPPR